MPESIVISIFTKFIPSIFKYAKQWWKFNRPAGKVLGSMINNKEKLKIFVKDLIVLNNTLDNPKLISIEGTFKQYNPNIEKVWPEVEAIGIARTLNLLGRLGKKDNLDIVEMSKGYDMWNSNLIVLGAQAFKSIEFYKVMESVGYFMDENEIYDNETKEIIKREKEYGYGLIIKAKNTKLMENKDGVGILLGGFGTLGTLAANYYFCNNISQLGKEFGNKYFSIVVRARIISGEQSVERLRNLDKVYNNIK